MLIWRNMKSHKPITIILALMSVPGLLCAAEQSGRETLKAETSDTVASGREAAMSFIDSRKCKQLRKRILDGDPIAEESARILRRRAEEACLRPAASVTDKQPTPHSPTRDPNDYVSIATYYWPNPETADGVPYVRRDGHLSPDINLYDRPRWSASADDMVTLCKAAYFLNEPRFADEAVRRIRCWFLDPETRMNPHLCYAQMIPGQSSGRLYGIIDFSLYLPTVLDHIRLVDTLKESAWSETDEQAMRKWCSDFLTWLEQHPFGQAEEKTPNNHGIYYDKLVVSLALFMERPERAAAQLQKTRPRITSQIKSDGSMPHELKRTCSFGYTVMNTRAFVELAQVGQRLGVDLWREGDNRISAAVEFILRNAASSEPWPYQQIEPIDWRMIWPLLDKADALAPHPYDRTPIAHRKPRGFEPDVFLLIEPIHPFGQQRSPKLGE